MRSCSGAAGASGGLGNPALLPGLGDRAAGLAPPPAAAAAAARARRAGGRARAAAAHGRRAAAAANVDDGHRHLGLDERHRRPAGPADRRRRGGQDADRQAAADVPARARSRSPTSPSSASPPTTDRSQVKGALDQLVAEGGTAMGDGLRARAVRGAHAGPEPGRQRHAAAAGRDRAALRRQEHVGQRATRSTSPARPRRAHIPIYAIALGTPGGAGRAARLVRLPADGRGPAGHGDAEGDRDDLRRASSFTATKADKLKEIYANLGTRLSSKQEKREVTVAFAGGGLVLLLLGGGLASRGSAASHSGQHLAVGLARQPDGEHHPDAARVELRLQHVGLERRRLERHERVAEAPQRHLHALVAGRRSSRGPRRGPSGTPAGRPCRPWGARA